MMLKTVRSPIRNSVKAALQASSETSLTWAHQPRAGVPAASPADKSPLEAGRRCGAPLAHHLPIRSRLGRWRTSLSSA